jgi:hypothetical protein
VPGDPPGRSSRAASENTRAFTGERFITPVRDHDVEALVVEWELVDRLLDELDLRHPGLVSKPGGLPNLLGSEIDSDHGSLLTDLVGGEEDICAGSASEVQDALASIEARSKW